MIPFSSIQVIIPALDEEATLPNVVETLRALGFTRIRVVDNGSTDATATRARAAGAEVRIELRRGYGQACWTGAQDLAPEVEWLLFCDADGSDDPRDVARLLAEAEAGADFVLGDRRSRPAARAVMTPAQNFGNALAVQLIRLGWGHSYRDLGPLRLIRRSLFESLAMRDRGFGWTIEMQVRAVERRACIVELPVGYHRRQGGRSKISGTLQGSMQAGAIILATLARLAGRQAGPRLGGAGLLVLAGAALLWPFGAATAANAPFLLAAAAVMGAGYILTWQPALARIAAPAWLFWGVAVGARLILVPMEPGDDVWRYLWEGRIQLAGYSPFQFPPLAPELAELRADWWGQINHRDKTAIYPPLLQLGFRGLAAMFGDVVWAWKLVFIAVDLAVCALLARRFGHAAALLFAWNPLVLYVTAGGAHFESLLILPLVVAWLAWERGGWIRAALAVGLSVGVKWVTAPLLGWLAWRQRHTPLRALATLALGAAPLGLALLWFRIEFGPLGALWPGEFVARARGMDLLPWLVDLARRPAEISNAWIPFLFIPLAGAVLLLARRFTTALEGYFAVLVACLPSVHPWYFTWLVPWAVATGNLGTRLLGLSAFAYFWIWHIHAMTGRWETTLAIRLLIWGPFVVGWVWWMLHAGRAARAVSSDESDPATGR